ncbi:MAG: type II toxin-antitoxin system HigB family toxin [Thermodesulfobacteriota bacterium]
MHVISRSTLKVFWEENSDAEGPLKAWFHEAKKAHWNSSQDIKARYATASIITRERVVFNIGGNKYRLVVAIHYKSETVYIRWVGTHEEYDAIDVKEV